MSKCKRETERIKEEERARRRKEIADKVGVVAYELVISGGGVGGIDKGGTSVVAYALVISGSC